MCSHVNYYEDFGSYICQSLCDVGSGFSPLIMVPSSPELELPELPCIDV